MKANRFVRLAFVFAALAVGPAMFTAGAQGQSGQSSNQVVSVPESATLPQPRVIATIPVGGFPRGIGIDFKTNRIYVANEGLGGSLSVIDGMTNSVVATVPFGCIPFGCSNPVGVAVNPDTERIYVADLPN